MRVAKSSPAWLAGIVTLMIACQAAIGPTSLASSTKTSPQSPADSYFPVGVFGPGNDGLDKLIRESNAEWLVAHDERPLFKTRHVPEQVYRILLIPSLQDSCTVRIEREESGWSLTGTIVGVATRGGHQAPGTIKATATRRLNEQESAQFTREIAAINLWSLRTWAECSRPQEGDTFYACVDGTSLILEGRRRGTEEPSYRAVDRDGGEGDGTMELASRFLSLSGFTWQCEQQ